MQEVNSLSTDSFRAEYCIVGIPHNTAKVSHLVFFNSLTLRLTSRHNVHSVNEAPFQEIQYFNLYSYYYCLINYKLPVLVTIFNHYLYFANTIIS